MTRIWKSGDRKTVWTKTLQKTYPDGSVEVWTVEKISVLDPRTLQVAKIKRGQLSVVQVFPASKQFYNARTKEPVHHTVYYIFSQDFHGGPGSSRDWLGGYHTGRMIEAFDEENMERLKSQGFKLVRKSA